MKKRALVLVVGLGALLLSGCMGPVLPPIAAFTACPDGSSNDLDMQFSSTSQTSNGHYLVFFRWDFGDGTVLDDYYGWVTHRYAEPGTYAVKLTVTDDRGVKATTEESVAVAQVVGLADVVFSGGRPARAVGELSNSSDLFLYSVSLKVKFYDQDGVRVGETYVEVTAIDPGERVRFVAEAPEDVGPIASAAAFVQSFAAECAGGVIPIPVPGAEDKTS